MQQHRHHFPAGVVAHVELLRARLAEHHGVHRFEVRGVRHQGQVHHLPARGRAIHRHSEVILHVPRPQHVVPRVVSRDRAHLELCQNVLHRLPDDVGEDVKAPAVRHPDRHCLHPHFDGAVDESLHPRDRRLHTLEAEALGDAVLGRQERLEVARERQPVVHVVDVRLRVLELVGLLKLVPDPVLLLHVRDVHELHANRPAVCLVKGREDRAQRLGARVREDTGRRGADGRGPHVERPVQVCLHEPEVAVVEEAGEGIQRLHVDGR
mmetsp:Transcript_19827/g.48031  ORF Transcript_19827/g.48031 Transcript_19827/m.48031 type:complete len:266 (+) Transcript_19827:2131-2928(+)